MDPTHFPFYITRFNAINKPYLPTEKLGFLNALSLDILRIIFNSLTPAELLTTALTCHTFAILSIEKLKPLLEEARYYYNEMKSLIETYNTDEDFEIIQKNMWQLGLNGPGKIKTLTEEEVYNLRSNLHFTPHPPIEERQLQKLQEGLQEIWG